MRNILKFLRQRRHITTYHHLLKRTGTRLEHPLISELYNTLVLHGDFSRTEALLREIGQEGLYNAYIHSCAPRARWKRLRPVDDDGVPYAPSARGGHAMCMDVDKGLIYLFGGWDGIKSMDDFWVYNVQTGRWREISSSVSEQKNGPGPRSCHKMEFDAKTGCIYMLGRLSDSDYPPNVPIIVSEEGTSTEREAGNTGEDPGVAAAGNGNTSAYASEDRRRRPGASTTGVASPGMNDPRTSCSEFYRYRTRGIDQGNWELLTFDTHVSFGQSGYIRCHDSLTSALVSLREGHDSFTIIKLPLILTPKFYTYKEGGSWMAIGRISSIQGYMPMRFGRTSGR